MRGLSGEKHIEVDGPVTIIPREQYESLVETLEILSDRKLIKDLEAALKDIRGKRLYTHEQVFGRKRKK